MEIQLRFRLPRKPGGQEDWASEVAKAMEGILTSREGAVESERG